MKDALDETLILSDKCALPLIPGAADSRDTDLCLHRIIQDLTNEIVVDIGALYKASEAVALLDLLWSFAHASISTSFISLLAPAG